MWNEENGSFHVYLNSDDDGQIRLNLGLGGGVQVQGGGKQPFQFSLGDKHQGPNSIEEILAWIYITFKLGLETGLTILSGFVTSVNQGPAVNPKYF